MRIEKLGVKRAPDLEYRIELDFQVPSKDHGPYRQSSVDVRPERVIVHAKLPAHVGGKLLPSEVIPVRVHPKDKGRVVIDEIALARATQRRSLSP